MPTFRIIAKYTYYHEAFIEADNEDEAWLEANKMDAEEFEELQEVDTWEIAEVYEQDDYTCEKFEPAEEEI